MNPENIKFPHIDVNSRAFFLLSEFIACDERGGILSEAFTMRRIAVDVVNELLQLIKAHIRLSSFCCSQGMTVSNTKGIFPMWPPGKRRIVLGWPCSSKR